MIETIEQGKMTKDLAICVHGTSKVGEEAVRFVCEDKGVFMW